MYDNKDPEELVTECLTVFIVIILILIGVIIGGIAIYKDVIENNNIVKTSTIEYVDSIKQDNNKLILEVNNLDSLKNAEIIEVKSLDNDSAIKLFYKLRRE